MVCGTAAQGVWFVVMKIDASYKNKCKKIIRDRHVVKKLLLILTTVFLMVILAAFYCDKFYNPEKDQYEPIYNFSSPVGPLMKKGITVEQPFSYNGSVRGVKLCMGTYQKKVKGKLVVELYQGDRKLTQGVQDLSKIVDCETFEVSFDNEVLLSGGTYDIKLTVENTKKGNELIFFGEPIVLEELEKEKLNLQEAREKLLQEMDPDERALQELKFLFVEEDSLNTALVNGEETAFGVGMELIGYPSTLLKDRDTFIRAATWLTVALVVLEGAVLFFHFKTENIFLISACVLALFYQFITVPVSVPDEDAHLTMTYHYSNMLMGKDSKEELFQLNEQTVSGEKDRRLMSLPTTVNRESYYGIFAVMDAKDVEILTLHERDINATAVSYLPGILGMTLGRLLQLPIMKTIYMGRFFSCAAYIGLCYFGIKKIPGNKGTLALVALLPISLHLGSSFSYDSLLLGGAIFFTGLVFLLYEQKKEVSVTQLLLLVLSVLILTSGKGIYVIMLGMLVFVPTKVWGGKLKQKLYLTALGSLSAISFVANMGALLTERNEIAFEKNNLQTSIIWEDPINFLFLAINTLLSQIDFYFRSLLGGYLGSFQFGVPMTISVIAFLLLIISTCFVSGKSIPMKKSWRVAAFTVFLLTAGASLVAAISWNSDKAEIISGVQGRYFLPVFSLLLLSASSWKQLELKKDISRLLILLMVCLNIYTLITIINAILQT